MGSVGVERVNDSMTELPQPINKMNSFIGFNTLDDQTKIKNSIGEGSDNLSTIEK
jgi:hypothetical protein